MSAHAALLWATVAIAAVFLVLGLLQLGAALRALGRLGDRVEGYGDLPVLHAAAQAEADVARIGAAAERIEPLLARAAAAIAIIRKGPFPEEAVRAYVRVRAELAAFRRFRSGLGL